MITTNDCSAQYLKENKLIQTKKAWSGTPYLIIQLDIFYCTAVQCVFRYLSVLDN